jgi:hypothetical protein
MVSATEVVEGLELQKMESGVEELLVPLEPSADFRDRLRRSLLASAPGVRQEVFIRRRAKVGAWIASVLCVAGGAVFLHLIARLRDHARAC